MENTKTMERSVIDFSKKSEIIQTILIWVLALVVPTFLGSLIKEVFGAQSVITQNSQIIVGTVVNTLLILSALNLKGFWKIAAVVTAPSVSTILSGFVFKSASPLMAWMIPAIWVGNFALIYAYKLIKLAKNKNYFLAGVIGVAVKVAIIFGFFNILRAFGVFPDKMVNTLATAMGTTQLITATLGVMISSVIYAFEKRSAKAE